MNKKLNKLLAKIEDFLELPPPAVSFEFFPPKNEESEKALWETIKELEPLKPKFVSVTYGAGGTTRERTHNTVVRIKKETSLIPAAHLTCINASKDEIRQIAENYLKENVNHIVALRGDPPEGIANYTPHPDGYHYAADLVKGLKKIGNFDISVAAFPEKHPESESTEKDLDYLQAKVDAGADRAITQYFTDPAIYLKYLEKVQKRGIKIPVIPGIIVISNFKQFVKFSDMCKSSIPKWMFDLFDGLDDTPHTRDMVAVSLSGEICRILRQEGIDQFHFYTLNRPHQTRAICRLMGIKG